jgi:hypothetical protein
VKRVRAVPELRRYPFPELMSWLDSGKIVEIDGVLVPVVMGGAEVWPDEGLDMVLAVFPKNGTNYTQSFIGLFTSFTASTVGTSGSVMNDYTDPSGGSYARQAIAAASWGSAAAGTGGRKVVAGQVTFPTATAVWGTVNGFMIVDTTATASDKCFMACNFDDTTAVTINTNDVIKVTPTEQYNN